MNSPFYHSQKLINKSKKEWPTLLLLLGEKNARTIDCRFDPLERSIFKVPGDEMKW